MEKDNGSDDEEKHETENDDNGRINNAGKLFIKEFDVGDARYTNTNICVCNTASLNFETLNVGFRKNTICNTGSKKNQPTSLTRCDVNRMITLLN